MVWKLKKPSETSIKIANCNTTIKIMFGDIFEQDGIRVIGASEYFDTKIGRTVSDKSLLGIFLKRCFSGFSETLDNQLETELRSFPATPEDAKSEGKKMCFPIGTSALVKANDDTYLLFALSKVDPATCKCSSDVELLWRALHRMWGRARVECGGHPLNLPLIGGGLSGLGLPTRDLLNLIILSAITETKAAEVTKLIRLILLRERADEIDLREVKAYWEKA
jgi:hypothetical protein